MVAANASIIYQEQKKISNTQLGIASTRHVFLNSHALAITKGEQSNIIQQCSQTWQPIIGLVRKHDSGSSNPESILDSRVHSM